MPGSYIVAGARTPIGKMSGALASLSAADLGGAAIAAALERAGVAPEEVDHVLMGQVLMAGQGQVPSRQAAVKAGPRQPVAIGDRVVRMNVCVPRLPCGQHAQRQPTKSRLFQRAQQYSVESRELIQFRDDPALACAVGVEPVDDSN